MSSWSLFQNTKNEFIFLGSKSVTRMAPKNQEVFENALIRSLIFTQTPMYSATKQRLIPSTYVGKLFKILLDGLSCRIGNYVEFIPK